MLFSCYYFGPIAYFVQLLSCDKFDLETQENYQKQTYRNRCYVLGANGRLRLGIPILHKGSRRVKDIQIANEFNWQKQHFKSLQSAYQSSPYFEFYEDDLVAIYQKKEQFLLNHNLNTLEFINQKLDLNLTYNLTETYNTTVENDFRNWFDAKNPTKENSLTYPQVFQEKFGFTDNLSILDLLFNEGPNAKIYLKNQVKQLNTII